MTVSLRFLSIGAGAIGSYIGSSLILGGQKVVFLERPKVAEELQSRGLTIKFNTETHQIHNPEIISSIEFGHDQQIFDLALFALKSYDTLNFLESIKSNSQFFPPVLCLSNGVENESTIGEYIGNHKVIAGTVTTSIDKLDSGDIVLEKLRGVGIADGHPLSNLLVKVFNDVGLNAHLYSTASDMKWSKMLTNLLSNATSAILDMTPSEIYSHPGLYRLENRQIIETLMVMEAQGIRVVDLPGTPARLLAFVIKKIPLTISRLLIMQAVGSGRGGKMPSFHIDLHSGRKKSEVDYLNGAVSRVGDKISIPTPANHFLNFTLLGLTKGDIPIRTYHRQPEKLLKDFNNYFIKQKNK